MKVVLLENVKKLGKVGEVVNVSDGYARNMLLPRKLAQVATPDVIKRVEKNNSDKLAKEKAEMENFSKLAREIKDKKITVSAKAKGGKLFGSVDGAKIAQEIKSQLGVELNSGQVKLIAPIKDLGEKKVEIEFLKNIKTAIIIEIKEEK